MIEIRKEKNQLWLIYKPDRFTDVRWVDNELRTAGQVSLRRTFLFKPEDLVSGALSNEWSDDDVRVFVLGIVDGDYYKVSADTLGLKYDLRLWKSMPITPKMFIAYRDISIFPKIDELIDEPITVGGNENASIPLSDFNELIRRFPGSTELIHYARARISRLLKDYFATVSAAQQKFEAYLKRKDASGSPSRIKFLEAYELKKYQYVRDELKQMLKDAESYSVNRPGF